MRRLLFYQKGGPSAPPPSLFTYAPDWDFQKLLTCKKGVIWGGREAKKASSWNVIFSPCRNFKASLYPPIKWTIADKCVLK